MLKVVLTDKRAVLHTLLVYDIAPKRELPDDIGAPLAELCGTDGVDSIAHRNDCIKVVEQRVASHLSRTFLLNYRDFLGSCLLVQFICVIYVLQMQTDVISGTIKKHSHCFLRSPYRLVLI